MFEKRKDYIVPLLKLLDGLPGRAAQTRQLLALFERRHRAQIPEKHFLKRKSGYERWVVYLGWARRQAMAAGLVDKPEKNSWRLTESGRQWLMENPTATRLDSSLIRRRAGKDDEKRRTARAERARYPAFFAALQTAWEAGLPEDAAGLGPKFEADRNWLKMHLRPFRGCHYEVRLAREYHEIGLHFESSKKRNEARRQAFEPHTAALTEQVGREVRAEALGRGWTRVWVEQPLAPPADDLAEAYGALAARFVAATLPILKSLPRRKHGPRAATAGVTDRRQEILGREVESIHAFLQGRSDHRPSDEKLCDWVQFCYTFELYAEGRDLFALIVPEGVNQWHFDRTKKLAQICRMRAEGR